MTEYELYQVVYLAATALCLISLVATVVLFFKLNISKVIGDLTGRNAKKAIQGINAQNESAKNADSGKVQSLSPRQITDRITPSGKIVRKENYSPLSTTEKIATAKIRQDVEPVPKSQEVTTTVPVNMPASFTSGETTILTAGETTILTAGETAVLDTDEMRPTENGQKLERIEVQETEASEEVCDEVTNKESTLTKADDTVMKNYGETTLLGSYFVIEEDITFIHSDIIV